MVERIPREKYAAKIEKFQKLRADLANLAQSKAAIARSLEEAKVVLDSLKELPDETELYKLEGFVLIPVTKAKLVKELEDRITELEARLAKLEKLEESYRKELERLMEELQALSSPGEKAVGG